MDVIAFFEQAQKLKGQPRTWTVLEGVPNGESIAEHSWATSLLAYLLAKDRTDLNLEKVMKMMIVHDVAESEVGDLLVDWKVKVHSGNMHRLNDGRPHGLSREEKLRLEREGCEKVAALLGENGSELVELWHEFERGGSPEAVFCRGIDKLELLLQAFAYENKHGMRFDAYFSHSGNTSPLADSRIRAIYDELVARRSSRTDSPAKGRKPALFIVRP
jgi:putative hydrolase of HD superfamily